MGVASLQVMGEGDGSGQHPGNGGRDQVCNVVWGGRGQYPGLELGLGVGRGEVRGDWHVWCLLGLHRNKKRGAAKNGPRSRGNFGSREELDSPNPKAKHDTNYNTRTRQTKAQDVLSRIQGRPPGTML